MNRFSPKIFYADYVQKADVEKAAKVLIFKKNYLYFFVITLLLNVQGLKAIL
jgi:hypothetical protein